MNEKNKYDKAAREQIEEIAKVIKSSLDGLGCGNFNFTGDEISTMFAEALYNAGYCKQSEGEWIGKTDYAGYGYYCSNCNAVFIGENAEWIAKGHLYCPKCGAKMKGGAE